MAYCQLSDVTTFLGESLSAEAEDAADALREAASKFVDRYTGRSWVAGTVTGEVQRASRGADGQGMIRLDRPPVGSVSSVSARSPYLGAASATLLAGSGYELIDAVEGLLYVGVAAGDLVTVTYTTAPVVPDDIKAATTMLVAHWARSATDATGMIFSKIKAGSAELTYREQAETLPADVKAILDGYRPAVAFA